MSNPSLPEPSNKTPVPDATADVLPDKEAPAAAPIPALGWQGVSPLFPMPGLAAETSAEGARAAMGVAQAPAPAVETAPAGNPSGNPSGNKEQLRRRVDARIAELETERTQLAADDPKGERAQAVENALQAVRDAVGGSWENVGHMEAAQLAQWLTSTESLYLAKAESVKTTV